MKPLKRPMFRSGGPIKEGIMNGMQEPQAVNTVGSPLAPRGNDGRQQYGFPLLLGAAGRLLARPFGTFIAKQFARPGVTGSGNLIRSGLGRTRTMQPGESLTTTRNIFQPNVAGRYLLGSPEAKAIGAVVKGTGKFGAPIKKVAKGVASSPLTLGSVVYYGGGALLPDGKPDPNDPKNVKPAGERGKSGAPGGGDPDMFLTPREKELSKDQKDKITKDRIEANRDRYYKLMGIDKMQKGAAYDSLIDASKIIQEEGGDLKGSIKSGNLQSRIIDAISKNLDKSTDLKRQIDAAILKGEITKDIKASDPSAKLAAELTKKRIELADKTLEGGSLSETLSELRTKQGIVLEGPELAALALQKNVDIPSGHTFNTKDVNTFLKDNPTLNIVDFVNDQNLKLQQAGKGNLDSGNYVVGKNIVAVGEDGTVTDVIL
jgi:hypothetical protein